MKRFLFIGLTILIGSLIAQCTRKNKMHLDYGPLNPNDIEVYWDYEGGGRFEEGPGQSAILIYRGGVFYDNIPYEYGGNHFFIVYKKQLVCRFGHLKLNQNYPHRYNLTIFQKQDSLYCAIDIRGKYKMRDTIPFTIKDNY